ncbi:virulence RhuM family protein [Belliella filtrata]|nr:virulence RhuM family protein [Belliella filtrata]
MRSDYDPSDNATQMFFAETQNKLLLQKIIRHLIKLIE